MNQYPVSRINQYWLTLPHNFLCKNLFKPVAVPIWDVRHCVVAAGGDNNIKHTPPTSAIPDHIQNWQWESYNQSKLGNNLSGPTMILQSLAINFVLSWPQGPEEWTFQSWQTLPSSFTPSSKSHSFRVVPSPPWDRRSLASWNQWKLFDPHREISAFEEMNQVKGNGHPSVGNPEEKMMGKILPNYTICSYMSQF